MKYVYRIGIELEGGWDNRPAHLTSDYSIDVDANYVGEVQSPPLRKCEIKKWLFSHYPDHVNETCGLHVHISMKKNIYYMKLMDKNFYRFFMIRILEWGKQNNIKYPAFWKRAKGENSYCQMTFNPDAQARAREKETVRYSHLNYCYKLHGTLEVRLLPMFQDKELAYQAICEVLSIIEYYLPRCSLREKEIRESLIDSEPCIEVSITDELDGEPSTEFWQFLDVEEVERKEEVICV